MLMIQHQRKPISGWVENLLLKKFDDLEHYLIYSPDDSSKIKEQTKDRATFVERLTIHNGLLLIFSIDSAWLRQT